MASPSGTIDPPKEVRLWQAHNPKARDFRIETLGPIYTSTLLTPQEDGTYFAQVPAPSEGFSAFFIEASWDRRGRRDRGLPDRGRHRRHLDDVHDPSPPFAWIPFGAGQHLCIGRDFAMMECTLILAMIVQRYRFAAVKGRVAEAGLSATLRPKGGVWAHLTARDRA